jgi:hypothetical protein
LFLSDAIEIAEGFADTHDEAARALVRRRQLELEVHHVRAFVARSGVWVGKRPYIEHARQLRGYFAIHVAMSRPQKTPEERLDVIICAQHEPNGMEARIKH